MRGGDRRCEDRRVERADGRVRDRRVCSRNDRRRARRRERERRDDRRRRRFDCRREEGRRRRQDHAHFDRRRRVARISGRPHAARRGGAYRQMRLPFIAGNWKMYKTVHDAVLFVKELKNVVKDVIDVEIVVAPPFTAIHAVAEAARNTNIGVAAQDVYWEREGAFTGEISPGMIKEAGAEYVIIGHSERRRLFGETDATVNRKIVAAIGANLASIVCVGESLEERERDETLAVLDRQIKDGLDR